MAMRSPRSNGSTAARAAPGGGDPAPEGKLARFLGWFSLVLGGAQVAAPGFVARLIGIRDDSRSRGWMRVVGVRELLAAAGILSRRRPIGWVSARVAGDAMDLALLGAAFATKRERTGGLAVATGAVAGIAIADTLDAIALSRASKATSGDGTIRVRSATTLRRPREQVYAYWHDFQNLPSFMDHLESVDLTGDGHSRWKAKAPPGVRAEWDAEILEDRPNELIAWHSTGGTVENFGVVRFSDAPGGRGTEVTLDMKYAAPAGALGATVAKLFGEEPEQQAKDDLRRFKQVLETGEIVRSDGSPEGITARSHLKQRPAHPVEGKPESARRTS
jgi:uncharacterized membrane protein